MAKQKQPTTTIEKHNLYTVKQIVYKAKGEEGGLAVFNPEFLHDYERNGEPVFECFASRTAAAAQYLHAGRKMLMKINGQTCPASIAEMLREHAR